MEDISLADLRKILEQYAQIVVKACLIINGGATVSVMAYIGTGNEEVRFWTVVSLFLFASGVLCAAVTSFLAYESVHWRYEGKQKNPDRPETTSEHQKGRNYNRGSSRLALISFAVFFLGVCVFCWSLLDCALCVGRPFTIS